jgi:hypothetical protein
MRACMVINYIHQVNVDPKGNWNRLARREFYQRTTHGARGGVVVMALRYKTAGRGFDSRWCHWNFSVT